jgi:multicomponent Na+:H+ antiporter subunit C
MILLTAITVGIIFAVSIYMMLGRELKGVCMGVFLLGHGANLAIIAGSGSPVGKLPPILIDGKPIGIYVDPLPQALILTAIVIGFAVQAFLLTLLVVTWRRNQTLQLAILARDDHEEAHGH